MVMQEIEEEPEKRIKKWLEQLQTFRNPTPILEKKVPEESKIEAQIREAAYYLSLKKTSYKDLCWALAERIQIKNFRSPKVEDIRKTAEEISNSSKTYDELCWLIAEFDISNKK